MPPPAVAPSTSVGRERRPMLRRPNGQYELQLDVDGTLRLYAQHGNALLAAEAVGITERAFKSRLSRCYARLGVHSAIEALRAVGAIREDWLQGQSGKGEP